ncbi:MAG: flavin-containing monooxygenase [Acidimicrobiales bacterium]
MDHVDVLILGAGLSGIGAACHLQTDRPGTTYAILEAREVSGGTWDLFRYPGVRSDSDMFTLGYAFQPWREPKAIADGPSILHYIRDTARQYGVDRHITYRRRAVSASWSSAEARWTVEFEHADTGDIDQMTCGFLWGNTGYYRYDEGYRPTFPGEERFGGRIVHPQHWPEDLDWAGKRIVVIGSGATAVTLVPALAETAGHVTMLQRSPTYIVSVPGRDMVADALRRVLPAKVAHALIRWKNVALTMLSYQLSRRNPKMMRGAIRKGVVRALPEGYDVDTHFNPRYSPWDQRLCLVPDGDLFEAISAGRASVVTDTIDTFTEDGIRLASGDELATEIVITATGLQMLLLGGITLEVDGRPVDTGSTVAYKGLMLCGVPNLALTFGYTNASWTLKADLTADYVCRLLDTMEERGIRQCTPVAPDPSQPTEPFLDFSSGYVTRAIADLPKQGTTAPWRLHQNYALDTLLLRFGKVDDEIVFSNPTGTPLVVSMKPEPIQRRIQRRRCPEPGG